MFRALDPKAWDACDGNAVKFVSKISQASLDAAVKNLEIRAKYDEVMASFNEYMVGKTSWFKREHPEKEVVQIAYFSAEFGLHESLPIYSGGLGVLAGDHCKSASDLGLPFVAVGMLYREGYFRQTIDAEGQQQALYEYHEWHDLAVRPALDRRGNEVEVTIDYPGRTVTAKVWKVQVGRIPLYLLDTDVDANSPEDRRMTNRLYGGNEETRIQQEILLGIGGVRALRKLEVEPTVFHMNEGHSVFLGLERLREYIHYHGLTFREAQEMVRATSLFTTHTPVPAGNDAFPPPLVEKYFRSGWESIGLSRGQFMALGLDTMEDGSQRFSLTVLALNLAGMANGVSELHGDVSRAMWQHVYPDVPDFEVPIDHITNGVHTKTWMSIDMEQLLGKYLQPDWQEHIARPETWAKVDDIPDEELWAVISKLRHDMVNFVHRRLGTQHKRFGETPDRVKEWTHVMDKDALTIGFARRFATYKRATLIFRDRARLEKLLCNPERPIQLVFSGKAHPADMPGQAFIQQIQQISREEPFHGRVIFLENYDMQIGRRLTTGVDVWLNNPRRPLEASGTSGMKVPLNGGMNCSILDGWWREAYRINPECGWALGVDATPDHDPAQQDDADAEAIYDVLEREIAPEFYERDEKGLPRKWLKRVRESLKTVAPLFSTNRMVGDYAEKFYLKASRNMALYAADRFVRARENAEWKDTMRAAWPSIRVTARPEIDGPNHQVIRVRDKIQIVAEVDLGNVQPDDVEVQVFITPLSANGRQHSTGPKGGAIAMRPDGKKQNGLHVYRGSVLEADSGEFGYTVRVVPKHPDLVHPNEMGLISWAQPQR
jgi:starch phosphorylase